MTSAGRSPAAFSDCGRAKPSLFGEDLRGTEGAKIACGKVHFQQLNTAEKPVEYVVASNFEEFTQHW